ncbi:MAG: sulfatase-like hydrolase/transferase, partial [Gammaproteobacteria bacterium]|nr:sulfatase-like hydrolase/transferase [Gammaproteobacteria bacterium]
KNLVVIYAESLERSYFDQNQFPGLIKHLRELETVSINFTNINQVYSTGFTIGGLTASQCGIPLIAPSGGNSMSGMDQFLPSAVCLGDLLRSSGYKLKYFGGAKLNFAGKGKLFTSHSFDEVYGLTELKPKLKDQNYQSYWGVHDDSLLEIVYNDFLNSSKTNEKFGIFLLTLDTHHPRGHINKSCEQIKYKNGKNAILNSIACSDLLISNFINKIKQSKYAENTIIVVLSDHLAMNNTAYTQLSEINRNNLLMIIDPSREEAKTIDKLGSTMDIGPTIMPYIGHKVDLGLGRDLLDSNVTNINQKLIHNNLRNWKKEITSFWDFPRIKNQLGIDIENDRISIDDRNFDIPILIELDTKLKTMLYFDADLNTNDSKIESGTSIDPNNYFLLIDRCSNVHRIAPYLKGSNYCFVTGKGNKIFHATKLTKNLTLDVTSIKFKLNIHNGFDAARVAHAGGGINGKTYTNSIEALDLNYQDGFRYFEIDFSFTTDNKMVCLHDWEDSFSRSFGLASTGKISESDFVELVNTKSKFKKCTAKSLAMWMRSHPDALIITDIKEQNIQGLKQLLKILPNAKNRVIPQIYFPENLKPIKKLGFEKIIWTLYKYSGSKNDILNVLDNNRHPIAVTMPIGRAKTDLPFLLDRMNIPSYVHTINDAELAKKYMFINGVTEIYTDFLSPGACCSELK